LIGTIDTQERTKLLEEEIAMRDFDTPNESPSDELPSTTRKGVVNAEDGHEYLEMPAQSGTWFIRNSSTGEWDRWQ
jgi:hypothetical protein